MSEYGRNIRDERKKANFYQYELADAIQVGQTAICRFEKNTRKPSVAVLKKIAKALGCSFAALIKEDYEDSYNTNTSEIINPSNEDSLIINFIRTLLTQNTDMSAKLLALARRREELTGEDWLILADHIAHALDQIETLLKFRA